MFAFSNFWQKKNPLKSERAALKRNLAVAVTTASILAQEAEIMKKYLVTGKQLEGLKKLIYDALFLRTGEERSYKFMIEDIEAQELDIHFEDTVKSSNKDEACKKVFVATFIPREWM